MVDAARLGEIPSFSFQMFDSNQTRFWSCYRHKSAAVPLIHVDAAKYSDLRLDPHRRSHHPNLAHNEFDPFQYH